LWNAPSSGPRDIGSLAAFALYIVASLIVWVTAYRAARNQFGKRAGYLGACKALGSFFVGLMVSASFFFRGIP
jgi:hypothetical protein